MKDCYLDKQVICAKLKSPAKPKKGGGGIGIIIKKPRPEPQLTGG